MRRHSAVNKIPQIKQSSIEESKNPNLDILGSSHVFWDLRLKRGFSPAYSPFFKEKIDNLFFSPFSEPVKLGDLARPKKCLTVQDFYKLWGQQYPVPKCKHRKARGPHDWVVF
jgi:hypothetical protein